MLANRGDTGQTAPCLIWICTVCIVMIYFCLNFRGKYIKGIVTVTYNTI